MPTATFTGTIKEIKPTETKGTFTKRSLILGELAPQNPQYPSTWSLEFHQAKCPVLDTFNRGDEVSCEVEITGREWKDTAFNTLKCFRITKTKAAPVVAGVTSDAEPDSELPF